MGVCCHVVVLVVVVTLACLTSTTTALPGVNGLQSESQTWWHSLHHDTGQPSLATDKVNVTALIGHTATLPCRVTNLGSRTVSWIRARDSAVLAVDRITITTDTRFSVNHPEETEDWQLEIRDVELDDEGTYDCQVNTHPKLSTNVHLKVISTPGRVSFLDIPVSDTGVFSEHPDGGRRRLGGGSEEHHDDMFGVEEDTEAGLELRVLGERWVKVRVGDTLRLVCEAKGKMLPGLNQLTRTHTQPLISWTTLDGTPITSYWSHTKVRIREAWSESSVESEVLVREMDLSDGGTYTCNAPHARAHPARVSVTVERYDGDGAPKVAMSGRGGMWSMSDASWGHHETADTAASASAASASTAAVVSGAIILVILIIQAALCVFYIKKV